MTVLKLLSHSLSLLLLQAFSTTACVLDQQKIGDICSLTQGLLLFLTSFLEIDFWCKTPQCSWYDNHFNIRRIRQNLPFFYHYKVRIWHYWLILAVSRTRVTRDYLENGLAFYVYLRSSMDRAPSPWRLGLHCLEYKPHNDYNILLIYYRA